MSIALSRFSVYTIRSARWLKDRSAKGGKGRFTEHKKWATGFGLLQQANEKGERLPIIFADAGNTHDGLIYYGFVTDLSPGPGDNSTICCFDGLCHLRSRPKHSLRLRSTGKLISKDFIRPLAYVHTPNYIGSTK